MISMTDVIVTEIRVSVFTKLTITGRACLIFTHHYQSDNFFTQIYTQDQPVHKQLTHFLMFIQSGYRVKYLAKTILLKIAV